MAGTKDSQPVEEEAESEDEGGTINDPLTHSDVEAPRVPFDSDPDSP